MTEQFQLLEQLGRGASSTVWKARDLTDGSIAAVKIIHAHLADDPYYVARFEREVEIAQRIDSPHVLKVLGYGKRENVPYLAMDFIQGKSLGERLPLEWSQARHLLRQVATGLQDAHRAGVLHRTIRPSCILVDKENNAKLSGFGLATLIGESQTEAVPGWVGTPRYLSPDSEATVQSDLYLFGCLAYEVLTGGAPFTSDTRSRVRKKLGWKGPDLAKVPPQGREIVRSLLERETVRRPNSVFEVVEAFGPGGEPND